MPLKSLQSIKIELLGKLYLVLYVMHSQKGQYHYQGDEKWLLQDKKNLDEQWFVAPKEPPYINRYIVYLRYWNFMGRGGY